MPCGPDLARQFREIGIPADRIITEDSSFDNRRSYCEHGTERAELPQAVQRLIFGIQYRKDGIKAHDVKDLLDRFL